MNKEFFLLELYIPIKQTKNYELDIYCHLSWVTRNVSCYIIYFSCIKCHVSPVTYHLSPIPIATTTDLPLLTPPLCTLNWFAITQTPKTTKRIPDPNKQTDITTYRPNWSRGR